MLDMTGSDLSGNIGRSRAMNAVRQGMHKVQVVIGRTEDSQEHNEFCDMMYRNQARNELYHVNIIYGTFPGHLGMTKSLHISLCTDPKLFFVSSVFARQTTISAKID